ncbi:hypothetical protein BaRGS_00026292 [Batillaria attramentaria]|uniref:Uncharacterized protein n=1 Tax=Batillaria attramentaria TaxID=370345 RepID=A0ABD0K6Q4_9CAEN
MDITASNTACELTVVIAATSRSPSCCNYCVSLPTFDRLGSSWVEVLELSDRLVSKRLNDIRSQSCVDSMECADYCCREVRGHRSRYYVCGTPFDEFMTYTCVKMSRSENDVLDHLI